MKDAIEQYFAGKISATELINHNDPDYLDLLAVGDTLLELYVEGKATLENLLLSEYIMFDLPQESLQVGRLGAEDLACSKCGRILESARCTPCHKRAELYRWVSRKW